MENNIFTNPHLHPHLPVDNEEDKKKTAPQHDKSTRVIQESKLGTTETTLEMTTHHVTLMPGEQSRMDVNRNVSGMQLTTQKINQMEGMTGLLKEKTEGIQNKSHEEKVKAFTNLIDLGDKEKDPLAFLELLNRMEKTPWVQDLIKNKQLKKIFDTAYYNIYIQLPALEKEQQPLLFLELLIKFEQSDWYKKNPGNAVRRSEDLARVTIAIDHEVQNIVSTLAPPFTRISEGEILIFMENRENEDIGQINDCANVHKLMILLRNIKINSVEMILSKTNLNERARMLEILIRIAHLALEQDQYPIASQIVSALRDPAIQGTLEKTFAAKNVQVQGVQKKWQELNQKREFDLPELLDKKNPKPIIPDVPRFLQHYAICQDLLKACLAKVEIGHNRADMLGYKDRDLNEGTTELEMAIKGYEALKPKSPNEYVVETAIKDGETIQKLNSSSQVAAMQKVYSEEDFLVTLELENLTNQLIQYFSDLNKFQTRFGELPEVETGLANKRNSIFDSNLPESERVKAWSARALALEPPPGKKGKQLDINNNSISFAVSHKKNQKHPIENIRNQVRVYLSQYNELTNSKELIAVIAIAFEMMLDPEASKEIKNADILNLIFLAKRIENEAKALKNNPLQKEIDDLYKFYIFPGMIKAGYSVKNPKTNPNPEELEESLTYLKALNEMIRDKGGKFFISSTSGFLCFSGQEKSEEEAELFYICGGCIEMVSSIKAKNPSMAVELMNQMETWADFLNAYPKIKAGLNENYQTIWNSLTQTTEIQNSLKYLESLYKIQQSQWWQTKFKNSSDAKKIVKTGYTNAMKPEALQRTVQEANLSLGQVIKEMTLAPEYEKVHALVGKLVELGQNRAHAVTMAILSLKDTEARTRLIEAVIAIGIKGLRKDEPMNFTSFTMAQSLSSVPVFRLDTTKHKISKPAAEKLKELDQKYNFTCSRANYSTFFEEVNKLLENPQKSFLFIPFDPILSLLDLCLGADRQNIAKKVYDILKTMQDNLAEENTKDSDLSYWNKPITFSQPIAFNMSLELEPPLKKK